MPEELRGAVTASETYEVVRAFVERVNRKAERKMVHTGKLEGAHYAAMREELAALERAAERATQVLA